MPSPLSVAAATSLLLAPHALAATCREDLGPGTFVDVDCGEGVGCVAAQMDLVSTPFVWRTIVGICTEVLLTSCVLCPVRCTSNNACPFLPLPPTQSSSTLAIPYVGPLVAMMVSEPHNHSISFVLNVCVPSFSCLWVQLT